MFPSSTPGVGGQGGDPFGSFCIILEYLKLAGTTTVCLQLNQLMLEKIWQIEYFYFICIFRKNKEIKGFLKEILIFNLKRGGEVMASFIL